jgi:adenylate kinase family enzyme
VKTKKHNAVLIVGPTGSGKTPLGEFLQQTGLWEKRCFHFDFGKALRGIGKEKTDRSFLTEKEQVVVLPGQALFSRTRISPSQRKS